MHIKTRWHDPAQTRSIEHISGTLAFIIWRVATAGAQSMQTRGWDIHDAKQRFGVITEFLVFLIHCADRYAHARLEDGHRQELINALALRLLDILEDNQRDLIGEGEYRVDNINLLNTRLQDYSEFDFDGDQPGFLAMRLLGHQVSAWASDRDAGWEVSEAIELAAPDAWRTLRKALRDLITDEQQPSAKS